MKNPFVWLTALGLGAVGAHFLGFDFHFFGWIDGFGETAGRGIRAALAAGGVVVFMLAAARPGPDRRAARDAEPIPKKRSKPDIGETPQLATARVRDRWPKLARRSASMRSSVASTASARSSRPGY